MEAYEKFHAMSDHEKLMDILGRTEVDNGVYDDLVAYLAKAYVCVNAMVPPTLVYIISTHEEHGSEDVHCTTDRDDVLPLLIRVWDVEPDGIECTRLKYILSGEGGNDVADYANSGLIALGGGWGALNLQIVEMNHSTSSVFDGVKRLDPDGR